MEKDIGGHKRREQKNKMGGQGAVCILEREPRGAPLQERPSQMQSHTAPQLGHSRVCSGHSLPLYYYYYYYYYYLHYL